MIDRLAAEHIKVAEYIKRIERIAGSLPEADSTAVTGLRQELTQLSKELLAHLAYEEEQLVPLLDGEI